MKWIETEKEKPRRGETVLGYWPRLAEPQKDGSFSMAVYATPTHWHNPEDDEDDFRPPTHWCRLKVPNVK